MTSARIGAGGGDKLGRSQREVPVETGAEVVPELVDLGGGLPPESCRGVGTRVNRQEHHEEGTAVRKNYQNKKIDTNQPAVPETVSVALTELAGEVHEGLLALAVGAGLQVLAAMMEADVTAVCGPKGRHDPARTATRHGYGAGSVTLGGRRVPVTRPRMRALDGSGELAVPAYELFSDTEVLGRMAMERMLAGLSTRRYRVGLEPVGARTEQAATATSKSAVSRRFVATTETALAQLLAADLSPLDVVALMIDGVHFGEHCCVVALGIDIDGIKPRDRQMPAAQTEKCPRSPAPEAAFGGGQTDARGLPRPDRAGRPKPSWRR